MGSGRSCLSELCNVCKEVAVNSMKEGRKAAWEKLPSYFDLPDWETLRTTIAASCVES